MNIWIFISIFVFFTLLSIFVKGGFSLSLAIWSLSLAIYVAYTYFGLATTIIVIVVTVASSIYISLKILSHLKQKDDIFKGTKK